MYSDIRDTCVGMFDVACATRITVYTYIQEMGEKYIYFAKIDAKLRNVGMCFGLLVYNTNIIIRKATC